MKKLFLLMLIAFFFSHLPATATTKNNPLSWDQQNCLKEHGELRVLSWQKPRPTQLEFCYFWGDQGMDIRTLNIGKYNSGGPEANRAYHKTAQLPFPTCAYLGGQVVIAKQDSNTLQKEICLFWDGSAIDKRTLENGFNSLWNQDLNRALGYN